MQDLAQDEHGTLARRQLLQRRDEREPQRVARLGDLGGVGLGSEQARVRDRLDPRVLGQAVAERRVGAGRRPEVHRLSAPLRPLQHVEADVAGDPVQPALQGGAGLQALGATPGPDHRLLHGVLGLGARAEHPVAVAGQRAAMRLEVMFERSAGGGAGDHNRTSYEAAPVRRSGPRRPRPAASPRGSST